MVTVMDEVVAPLLHNKVPVKFAAVNTELPQLLTTDTVGADGITLGADVPLPAALVHPFTVCVTVYAAALDTVIEVLLAPLLHNNDPVKLPAVNTELPQLLTTDTVGADGITFGAETPLPVALIHPFTVCVTVYAEASVTVTDAVVAPLLHNNDPVKFAAVNTELPQLLTTDTDGADGITFGADIPLPAALVHPFIVCAAVYVAESATVIEFVIAPLLHNKDPVKFPAVNTVLPQLLTTNTVGAAGITFGADIPLPAALIHPFTV